MPGAVNLEPVKIVECPRDAWQGISAPIPSQVKAAWLRKLINAGFKHIDAVSFVSPAAVPQMADSERVLELLGPQSDAEIIGIIVNEQGAERAIRTGAVHTLGFPYSISVEFLQRNQNQSQQESLAALQAIVSRASNAGLNVVAYLSMAFGNPYGQPWSIDAVVEACTQLADIGINQISLADTVGVASPGQIGRTVAAVIAAHPEIEIGLHLHTRRDKAAALVTAAYTAGCRRFDAVIGGLGGCPFAQDELVGNLPTETLLEALKACGAKLPQLAQLNNPIAESSEIFKTVSTHS